MAQAHSVKPFKLKTVRIQVEAKDAPGEPTAAVANLMPSRRQRMFSIPFYKAKKVLLAHLGCTRPFLCFV